MPRQSRMDRVLAEKQDALEQEVAKAAAEAERLGSELRLVKTLRAELSKMPRRPSRAKRTVALPAQPPAAA